MRRIFWLLVLVPVSAFAAPEICDDYIDNDGDGDVDEPPFAWYADTDHDSWGDPASVAFTLTCDAPNDFVDNDGDCDDTDNHVSPDDSEGSSIDGIDQDCDYAPDDLPTLPTKTYRGQDDHQVVIAVDLTAQWTQVPAKCDAMGYHTVSIVDGTEDDTVEATADQAGSTQFWIGLTRPAADWTWEDGTALGYQNWAPGQPKGGAAEDCGWIQADSTGNAGRWTNDKCGDSRPYTCELDCTVPTWPDSDGDGLGDPNGEAPRCGPATGLVLNGADCDDARPDVGIRVWYRDGDGDGHGDPDPGNALLQCDPPTDYVADPNDCNDSDEELNDDTAWYADDDGDGFGAPTASSFGCTGGPDTIRDSGDCDDGDGAVNPDADEVCDGADDDCDGDVDDADDDVTGSLNTFYPDGDGDGYGLDGYPIEQCSAPDDYSAQGGDCNDSDALANPSAPEQCSNGVDDDCDGQTDESTTEITWYFDADRDGYGDPAHSRVDCASPGPDWVLDDTDCDDGSDAVHPGAAEIPDDGVDQDCDGSDSPVTDPTTDPTGTGSPSTADRDPAGGPAPVGCGCTGGAGPGSWVSMALAVFAVRRRPFTRHGTR